MPQRPSAERGGAAGSPRLTSGVAGFWACGTCATAYMLPDSANAASAARARRLQPGADILLGTAIERRLRAIHVAQTGALPLRREVVGADGRRRVGDSRIQDFPGIGESEE